MVVGDTSLFPRCSLIRSFLVLCIRYVQTMMIIFDFLFRLIYIKIRALLESSCFEQLDVAPMLHKGVIQASTSVLDHGRECNSGLRGRHAERSLPNRGRQILSRLHLPSSVGDAWAEWHRRKPPHAVRSPHHLAGQQMLVLSLAQYPEHNESLPLFCHLQEASVIQKYSRCFHDGIADAMR